MSTEKRVIVMRDDDMRQRTIKLLLSLDLRAPWSVAVAPYEPNRTLAQNSLLHFWCRVAAKQRFNTHGEQYSPITWKDHFKSEFLGEESLEFLGRVLTRLKSTAGLSVRDFSEFLDRIDHYAADDLGIMLPHTGHYDEAMGRR